MIGEILMWTLGFLIWFNVACWSAVIGFNLLGCLIKKFKW